jgi:hypothetical protein
LITKVIQSHEGRKRACLSEIFVRFVRFICFMVHKIWFLPTGHIPDWRSSGWSDEMAEFLAIVHSIL